jgi:hypothetical protein
MAKVALLIGVSEYQPGLNALPAAEKDVLAIKEVLINPEFGGFAEEDVQVLINASASDIRQAIEIVFADREKQDLIVLFYSGHGVKDEGYNLYLAAHDTQMNNNQVRRASAVECSFIHLMMSESKSKQQVIILDCCFSGAFAKGLTAKADVSIDVKSQLQQDAEGRVVLTSSTSAQPSFESQKASLGVYTSYLIEGIKTGYADEDGDGVISIDELHNYAKRKLREEFPKMKPEIYAVKEGYKIAIARAKIKDPYLRYRQEVEACLQNGKIPDTKRANLDHLLIELDLPKEQSHLIESEVLEAYEQKQKQTIKKIRRIWTVVISLMIFIVGIVLSINIHTVLHPKPKSPFIIGETSISQIKDVQPSDWYFQAMQSLVERYKITPQLYSDGTFNADYPIRKDELIDYLWRTLDAIIKLGNTAVEDTNKSGKCKLSPLKSDLYIFNPPMNVTPQTAWYYESYKNVAKATNIGNIDQTLFISEDKKFYPDKNVTRAESYVAMNRLLDAYNEMLATADAQKQSKRTYSPSSTPTVSDDFSISQVTSVSQFSDVKPTAWYFNDLQSLVERYGCVAGYPNATFRAEQLVTRADYVAGINACLDRLNELVMTVTADCQ